MKGPPVARKALLGAALLLAVVPPLTTWTAIVRDPSALVLAGGGALGVIATGIVVRTLRVPERFVVALQVIVLAGVLAWVASSLGGLLRVPALVADGVRHLATSSAPVSPSMGTTLLLFIAIGVLALAADVVTIALEHPLAALAPLLVLLLVPALVPKTHAGPVTGMLWFALGFTAVLLAGNVRFAFPEGLGGRLVSLAAAGLVASLALGAALIIAPRIPLPSASGGQDGEPIQMADVSLDLKRQINQGADRAAFDYTTSDGAGAYLRLYSLPTFSAGGWHLINSPVQTGRLPAPPGLDRGTALTTKVTITGLQSEWLPAPYAPTSTTAGEKFGFLPDSLAFLALGVPGRASATSSLSYTVQSVQAKPTFDELAAAQAGSPPDAEVTASVPSDISPTLVRLAHDITAGAATPGAKVQAILAYLKRPEFSYSLDAQPGSGYEGLEAFLLRDHKGFCVQYASSVALLARIEGIPSRIAIGFTPGRFVGDRWTVTMHDMHAWPELYLAGWGWVSFEPTPGIGSGSSAQEAPTRTTTPTTTSTPTSTPSAARSASSSASSSPRPAAGSPGGLPRDLLIGLGIGLVVTVALAATPALLRGRMRRARLAPGRDPSVSALDALDEIRAIALDAGRPWPAGSPRYAASEVAAWVDGTASAQGVREVGMAAERAQFGGPGQEPSARDWTPVATGFAADLAARTASKRQRFRARWLPASLFG